MRCASSCPKEISLFPSPNWKCSHDSAPQISWLAVVRSSLTFSPGFVFVTAMACRYIWKSILAFPQIPLRPSVSLRSEGTSDLFHDLHLGKMLSSLQYPVCLFSLLCPAFLISAKLPFLVTCVVNNNQTAKLLAEFISQNQRTQSKQSFSALCSTDS